MAGLHLWTQFEWLEIDERSNGDDSSSDHGVQMKINTIGGHMNV